MWKNQIKNFSNSHLSGTKTVRRYPRHPLWGIPQQSFRTDKARLPQSVEASLLFWNTASLNIKGMVVLIDFAIFVLPANATKRVGKELPMRFSIDRTLKIDI